MERESQLAEIRRNKGDEFMKYFDRLMREYVKRGDYGTFSAKTVAVTVNDRSEGGGGA